MSQNARSPASGVHGRGVDLDLGLAASSNLTDTAATSSCKDAASDIDLIEAQLRDALARLEALRGTDLGLRPGDSDILDMNEAERLSGRSASTLRR